MKPYLLLFHVRAPLPSASEQAQVSRLLCIFSNAVFSSSIILVVHSGSIKASLPFVALTIVKQHRANAL